MFLLFIKIFIRSYCYTVGLAIGNMQQQSLLSIKRTQKTQYKHRRTSRTDCTHTKTQKNKNRHKNI